MPTPRARRFPRARLAALIETPRRGAHRRPARLPARPVGSDPRGRPAARPRPRPLHRCPPRPPRPATATAAAAAVHCRRRRRRETAAAAAADPDGGAPARMWRRGCRQATAPPAWPRRAGRRGPHDEFLVPCRRRRRSTCHRRHRRRRRRRACARCGGVLALTTPCARSARRRRDLPLHELWQSGGGEADEVRRAFGIAPQASSTARYPRY